MRTFDRIAAAAGRAPEGALSDALGMAALCLICLAGFTATSFV